MIDHHSCEVSKLIPPGLQHFRHLQMVAFVHILLATQQTERLFQARFGPFSRSPLIVTGG